MQQASLVATLTTPPTAAALQALPGAVEWLEVRGDLAGDPGAENLRRDFPGRLLYSAGALGGEDRRPRLAAAAADGYDLVELDAERDLDAVLLERVPPAQRLVSWRGPALGEAALRRRCESLTATPARLYRLLPAADGPEEAVRPLKLLSSLGRRDVLAWARGTAGFWSRLIAPRLGCPMVFATLTRRAGEGVRPSLEELTEGYGLPALPPLEGLCALLGRNVLGSLSPRLHNGSYRHLRLPYLYLPIDDSVRSFDELWPALGRASDALGLPWRGFTVVAPYKAAASKVAGQVSAVARRAATTNLLVRTPSNGWSADTTDPAGVLEPLRRLGVELRGRPAAVVGAGGAGRAAAVALAAAGARVTLVHRQGERGRDVALQLGVGFADLATFRADVFAAVVHATPIGRDGVASAFDPATLRAKTAVVDMVYGSLPTALVTAARAAGCPTADGHDVLLAETRRQLKAMTGQEIPGEILSSFLRSPTR